MSGPAPVYRPTPQAIEASRLTAFQRFLAERGAQAGSWPELQRFALDSPSVFWSLLVEWLQLPIEGSLEPTRTSDDVETCQFFPGLRLCWAEALLRPLPGAGDEHLAIVSRDEAGRRQAIRRGELRARVQRVMAGLRRQGMTAGDHVAAIGRNQIETVIAALAATALGATWSTLAPDMAPKAIIDRLGQLSPRWLFTSSEWSYQGARKPLGDVAAAAVRATPSIEQVVVLDGGDVTTGLPTTPLSELATGGALPFTRRPFNHPLFVLFSSGTTGPPKCIVHGQGGTLVEHLKEHVLHTDLGPADRLYYHTSAAWMMWNWALSALGAGATVVLYDGSVSYPERDSLLRLLEEEEVTVFGTSPSYLSYLRDGRVPVPGLPALRAILSTGSILYDNQYDDAKAMFGDVPVASISGGTDIIGCFVLGNPTLPVWRGESPCVSLGLDVRAADGDVLLEQGTGELVCAAPFPSRPLGLLGDSGGERFHATYFSQHPGVWTHGDFISLTERGTARMLGRSDGVLNIRGIRIGPAEIYGALSDLPEVAEAMAIDQAWQRAIGGRRLVLLVVLAEGVSLDRPLTLRIKRTIKERTSQNHVPDLVVAVPALPTTLTGKRSERAAADLLNRREVRNEGALANPECLHHLRALPELEI